MATKRKIRTLKRGDLIRELGVDYVITSVNKTGKSGTMNCIHKSPYIKGEFFQVYFEEEDLSKMTRKTLTKVPKKLSDLARKIRK